MYAVTYVYCILASNLGGLRKFHTQLASAHADGQAIGTGSEVFLQYGIFVQISSKSQISRNLVSLYFISFNCPIDSKRCMEQGSAIVVLCANFQKDLGRVTHICVSRLTITGADNGLSPGHRQAIFWTNAEILLTGPLRTNLIEIPTFSFRKIDVVWKMAAFLSRHQCVKMSFIWIFYMLQQPLVSGIRQYRGAIKCIRHHGIPLDIYISYMNIIYRTFSQRITSYMYCFY